jgi:hypothetical protein
MSKMYAYRPSARLSVLSALIAVSRTGLLQCVWQNDRPVRLAARLARAVAWWITGRAGRWLDTIPDDWPARGFAALMWVALLAWLASSWPR